jgi:hypothetical protein
MQARPLRFMSTTLAAGLAWVALLPAQGSSTDVQNQYGTRHAYQTAPYSEAMRKRFQSRASAAATILEQDRMGSYASRRTYQERVMSERARRAYQTNHKNPPADTGTRHAYET